MATARSDLSLTLLPNGKVLAAGGSSDYNAFCSAELYDPATGAWTPTGAMHECRYVHSAVLLTNGALSGRVLVAGGLDSNYTALKSAELYDPQTGKWSQTGSIQIARFFAGPYNSVALNDGSTFIVGGNIPGPTWLNSAETFSPQTGMWTIAAGKKTHAQGAAALMKDGRVLVASGNDNVSDVAAAEIFDPTSRTWKATVSMPNARNPYLALTTRENGRVVLSGGSCRRMGAIYFPKQVGWGTFVRTLMVHARGSHTATLLSDNSILAAGGADCERNVLSSAENYRPVVVAFAGSPGRADCVEWLLDKALPSIDPSRDKTGRRRAASGTVWRRFGPADTDSW
jgi:hypothetical protein